MATWLLPSRSPKDFVVAQQFTYSNFVLLSIYLHLIKKLIFWCNDVKMKYVELPLHALHLIPIKTNSPIVFYPCGGALESIGWKMTFKVPWILRVWWLVSFMVVCNFQKEKKQSYLFMAQGENDLIHFHVFH